MEDYIPGNLSSFTRMLLNQKNETETPGTQFFCKRKQNIYLQNKS